MVRKILTAFLAAALALTAAACGEKEESSVISGNKPNVSSSSSEPASSTPESSSESSSAPSKPQLVEERFYQWEENQSMVITVDIFSDGGRSLSWSMGAEYYVDYSPSDEASGIFAPINGYRLLPNGDTDMVDGGAARFTINNDTLTMQYENKNGGSDENDIRNFKRIYR